MEKLTTEGLTQVHAPTQAPTFRKATDSTTSSEVTVTRPATDKQVAFLRKLVAERYPAATEEYVASVISEGSARVSKAIDRLQAAPVTPKVQVPRTNRYGGRCEHCGTRVDPEQGVLTMSDSGEWEVAHKPGECPVSEFPFPVGRYALHRDEGVKFYVASHDGLFAQASDELFPVHRGAQASIIAAIAEDPEVASRLYGTELGKCGRCGRTLTDAVSRAAGMGPVCSTRSW